MQAFIINWLKSQVLKRLPDILLSLFNSISEYFAKKKKLKEQEEAKKKLDEVVADPKSKVEERADAFEKYINS